MSKKIKLQNTPKNNEVTEPKRKEVSHFTISVKDVTELGDVIASLVSNKYKVQTIFNAMNDMLKPVFKE